ncbi:hypothetical protein ACWDUX_11405 [Streptomyces sp. NPDC003444]
MVEKFKELTDPEDGLPEASIDRDRFLTGISLYWLTATAGSAAQVYYETVSANDWGGAESDSNADGTSAEAADGHGGGQERGEAGADWAAALRGTVPTGVLLSAYLDTGGHFLSMGAPDQLVDDVRSFFHTLP